MSSMMDTIRAISELEVELDAIGKWLPTKSLKLYIFGLLTGIGCKSGVEQSLQPRLTWHYRIDRSNNFDCLGNQSAVLWNIQK